MSREVHIECIWLPSHCRLPKTMLPTSWIEEESRIQSFDLASVPIAWESAQSFIKPTVGNSIVRVYSLPGELTTSNRSAEAVLHQLLTNSSPLAADFHLWSCGDDYIPYSPICERYSQGVMILRGVGPYCISSQAYWTHRRKYS